MWGGESEEWSKGRGIIPSLGGARSVRHHVGGPPMFLAAVLGVGTAVLVAGWETGVSNCGDRRADGMGAW